VLAQLVRAPCRRCDRSPGVGPSFVCLETVARGGSKLAVGWVGAEEEEEQEGEGQAWAAVLSSPPPWLPRRS
jgi:hypothetical protein